MMTTTQCFRGRAPILLGAYRNTLGVAGLAFIACLCCGVNEGVSHANLPSLEDQGKLTSPNGSYVLVSVLDSDSPTKGRDLSVVLEERCSGKKVTVLNYSRWVSALWCPDSRKFFVNDYEASNSSNCYVFTVEKPSNPTSIAELMESENEVKGCYPFLKNDKVYIEGVKWGSDKSLAVVINGYGEYDTHGYCYTVEYVLGSGLKNLRKVTVSKR